MKREIIPESYIEYYIEGVEFTIISFKKYIYSFLERGEGKEKERCEQGYMTPYLTSLLELPLLVTSGHGWRWGSHPGCLDPQPSFLAFSPGHIAERRVWASRKQQHFAHLPLFCTELYSDPAFLFCFRSLRAVRVYLCSPNLCLPLSLAD